MGKIEDAIDKLQNGISICEEIEYPRFQGFAYESFGLAYLSMQRYKEAFENFQKALTRLSEIEPNMPHKQQKMPFINWLTY